MPVSDANKCFVTDRINEQGEFVYSGDRLTMEDRTALLNRLRSSKRFRDLLHPALKKEAIRSIKQEDIKQDLDYLVERAIERALSKAQRYKQLN